MREYHGIMCPETVEEMIIAAGKWSPADGRDISANLLWVMADMCERILRLEAAARVHPRPGKGNE